MSVPSVVKYHVTKGVTASGKLGADAMNQWGIKKFVGTTKWCTLNVKSPKFNGKINFKFANGVNADNGWIVKTPLRKFIGVKSWQLAALLEALINPTEEVEILNT